MIVTRGLDSGGLRPAEQGALGLQPAHNAGRKGSLERQIFSKICLDCSRSPGADGSLCPRRTRLSCAIFPPFPIDKSPIKR